MDNCLLSEVITKTLLSPASRLSKAWVNTTPCRSIVAPPSLEAIVVSAAEGGLVTPVMLDIASVTEAL